MKAVSRLQDCQRFELPQLLPLHLGTNLLCLFANQGEFSSVLCQRQVTASAGVDRYNSLVFFYFLPLPCQLTDTHLRIFIYFSAITEAIEIPQFIGRSYLTYDNPDILKR